MCWEGNAEFSIGSKFQVNVAKILDRQQHTSTSVPCGAPSPDLGHGELVIDLCLRNKCTGETHWADLAKMTKLWLSLPRR